MNQNNLIIRPTGLKACLSNDELAPRNCPVEVPEIALYTGLKTAKSEGKQVKETVKDKTSVAGRIHVRVTYKAGPCSEQFHIACAQLGIRGSHR